MPPTPCSNQIHCKSMLPCIGWQLFLLLISCCSPTHKACQQRVMVFHFTVVKKEGLDSIAVELTKNKSLSTNCFASAPSSGRTYVNAFDNFRPNGL